MRSIALAFLLAGTVSAAHGADVARVTITSDDGRHEVPEGQVWKIERLHPDRTETGVGTADLFLEGGVQIGDNRELNVYGTFDLTLSGTQQVPLWILAGSKVAVGDSRGSVPIEILSFTAATATATAPDEVVAYVAERDLCEHFRGEPTEGSDRVQIERREFLRQSVEIYCAGTDRRLAALKQRYNADKAALSLLEKYETSSEGI